MPENDLAAHIERGLQIQRRMASSPCEFIEVAFEAERHALDASGAGREDLRYAIATTSSPESWNEKQRSAFVAWVAFLDEKLKGR